MVRVFRSEDGNSQCFCTLGGAVAQNGDILVFCEGRVQPKDFDAHHLIYKRSRDGGQTWQECMFLERAENDECYMNPVPLLNPKSGRLFVMYALAERSERTRLFVRHSDDHGHTWSDRRDLTALFHQDPHNRAYHLPGPGHGLAHSGGRLLMPIWHRHGMRWIPKGDIFSFDVPEELRAYGNSVLYSDDNGEEWKSSAYLAVADEHNAPFKMAESRLVEYEGGRLLLHARVGAFDQGNAACRAKAYSDDEGRTWTCPVFDRAVQPMFYCDAGLAKGQNGTLYMSRPCDPSGKRKCLTLYSSTDEAQTWAEYMLLEPGDAGYSDIIALPDSDILVCYACGYYNGYFHKEIRCQRIRTHLTAVDGYHYSHKG